MPVTVSVTQALLTNHQCAKASKMQGAHAGTGSVTQALLTDVFVIS
jgi:hypothetical protein